MNNSIAVIILLFSTIFFFNIQANSQNLKGSNVRSAIETLKYKLNDPLGAELLKYYNSRPKYIQTYYILEILYFNRIANPNLDLSNHKPMLDFIKKEINIDMKDYDGFIDKYSAQASFADSLMQYEVVIKNYVKALVYCKKSIIQFKKHYEYQRRIKKRFGKEANKVYFQRIEEHIISQKLKLSILYSLLDKNEPRLIKINQEYFLKMIERRSLSHALIIKQYLTYLLVQNDISTLNKFILKLNEYGFFICKEYGVVYFKWFQNHRYWLNSGSLIKINRVKKIILFNLRPCY